MGSMSTANDENSISAAALFAFEVEIVVAKVVADHKVVDVRAVLGKVSNRDRIVAFDASTRMV